MERGFNIANRAIIPVLVPMFLIISSSVYPAIMSSMENREIQIISNVMAQLNDKNTETNSNHRSTMPMPSSEELVPSSPTPIDPVFSATSSTLKKSSDTQASLLQHDEEDDKMTTTAINPGDRVPRSMG